MARPPIEQKEATGASIPDGYLEYPHRSYGMDHDRYDWSLLVRRTPVQWPNGARIALWVNVAFEFFPLDTPAKPFKALGGIYAVAQLIAARIGVAIAPEAFLSPEIRAVAQGMTFVCASAGIDRSTVAPDIAALLPEDSDRSARRLRAAIAGRVRRPDRRSIITRNMAAGGWPPPPVEGLVRPQSPTT